MSILLCHTFWVILKKPHAHSRLQFPHLLYRASIAFSVNTSSRQQQTYLRHRDTVG